VKRLVIGATAGCLAVVVLAAVPQSQTPQQPTFRARVELFHLDVSVLDRQRRPVPGLTAADFTVLEDGKPQKIVALSAIEVPDPEPAPAVWMTEVSPDVASNHLREQRLVVIVMDDATIPFDQRAIRNAKRIGLDIVNRLGPADVAAVVFTQNNRRPQDFTRDRARLTAAIERTTYGNRTGYSYLSAIETLWAAAQLLIEIPERRKTLVYISGGVPVDIELGSAPALAGPGVSMMDRELQRRLIERTREIFFQAAQANVNVYTFDVCGLRAPGPPIRPGPCDSPMSGPDLNIDFLETVAAGTGGRAAVNTHDFAPAVERVFRENASYYLLGYESTAAAGSKGFRRIDVRVNRPDVEVRARTMNYTAKPAATEGAAMAVAATKALAGLLPKVDLPLAAQLAPIAIPGRRDLVGVAVTMALRASANTARDATASREVDFEIRAFDPEGRPRGGLQQQARVALRPNAGEFTLEFLARLDLKPGAYQFRMSAHDRALDRSGSVYADVEVPDFAKAPVALSGVLLTSSGAPAAAGKDALAALVKVVPTASRDFASRTERVTAFVRVYQGGDARRPLRPVKVAVSVQGVESVAATESIVVDPARFVDRAADVSFPLDLSRLAPGHYLLTIDAVIDDRIRARRDVRFTVR
jgi:VWFA-related protein